MHKKKYTYTKAHVSIRFVSRYPTSPSDGCSIAQSVDCLIVLLLSQSDRKKKKQFCINRFTFRKIKLHKNQFSANRIHFTNKKSPSNNFCIKKLMLSQKQTHKKTILHQQNHFSIRTNTKKGWTSRGSESQKKKEKDVDVFKIVLIGTGLATNGFLR